MVCSQYLFDELVAEGTSGAEALLLQRHVLFGLRVERGVLDQAVDKQPHVVLHLGGEGEEEEGRDTLLRLEPPPLGSHSYRTWKGLTATPALFFFFTTSMSLLTTWSAT